MVVKDKAAMTPPDDSGAQQGPESIIECTEGSRMLLPLAIPEVRAHLDILKGAFSLIQGRSADVHEGLSAWLQSDEGAGEAETLQAWLASATCTLQGLLAVVQNEHQGLENAGLQTGHLPIDQALQPHAVVMGPAPVHVGSGEGMLVSGPAEVKLVRTKGLEASIPQSPASLTAAARDSTVPGTVTGEGASGEVIRLVPPRCSRLRGSRASLSLCRHAVLQNRDLAVHIFSFLASSSSTLSSSGSGQRPRGAHARQHLRALLALSRVCRRWREAAAWGGWWGPIAESVAPLLRHTGQAPRAHVLGHGRRLAQQRKMWLGRRWAARLSMHVEVFDMWDGLPLLSVHGPLGFEAFQGNDCCVLCVPLGPRVERRGPPVSASSRDPSLRSMRQFFSSGHEASRRSDLRVRVHLRDEDSGRVALVWEEDKSIRRQVCEPSDYWRPFLPPGSFWVGHVGSQPVACPTYHGPPLTGRLSFYACPEPGQEDIAEEHKLYRLAGEDVERYGEHCSFVRLFFDTPDERAIAQYVCSLLEKGC